LPTLKVIQLPSPTQGMRSPVDGIGLPIGDAGWAAPGDGAIAAATPAMPASTARLLGSDLSGILDLPRRKDDDLARSDGS
jgi:hypothetical protein